MTNDLALLMTDTHLQENTIETNRSIFRQAIEVCKEREIRRIFHLGDVFHSRKAQTLELLLVFNEILDMIYEEDLEIVIIPGNHDKTNYSSPDSFLHPFRHHPALKLVHEYMGVGSSHYPDFPEDMIVMFAPFFDEKSGKYAEILSSQHHKSISLKYKHIILLTHIGVNDAVMNGGSVIEDHVESSLFEPFTKVLVGHFHDYQELDKGKITYIGSAYQSNYGEDNKKGFQILKSDGNLEFIKTKFPEYKKIVVDINTTTKEDLVKLKRVNADSSDNIRFVFKGDREKLSKIDKNEFTILGIDVKTEESNPEVLDYSLEAPTTFNSSTIKEEWKDYTQESEEIQTKGTEYLQKTLK